MSWWAATETGELKREVFHFLSISRDIFKVWFTPLMIYCLGLLVTSPLKLTWEIRERNNTFKAQRGWRPSQPHTFLHFYCSQPCSKCIHITHSVSFSGPLWQKNLQKCYKMMHLFWTDFCCLTQACLWFYNHVCLKTNCTNFSGISESFKHSRCRNSVLI